MSESKFTPGPWRCEIDDDTQEPRIYAPQRENKLREQLICAVGYCREELETSEPTARLIAAAPELYEALVETLREAEEHYCDIIGAREAEFQNNVPPKVAAAYRAELDRMSGVIERARAALLKATPEQSDAD